MSPVDQDESEAKADMDALSRAYRDARERDGMAPPAALDDTIRAAAHRAVFAGPQRAGKSGIRRWTPQLAVAAVVVLSVSVVIVSIEERPELAPASIQKIALNRVAETPPEAAAPVQARIVSGAPAQRMEVDAVKKKAPAESGAATADAPAARQKEAPLLKDERSSALMAPSVVAPPPVAGAVSAPAPPVYSPPAAPLRSPPASPAMAPPPVPAIIANAAPEPFPAADAVAPARKETRADARNAAVREAKPVEEKVALSGAARSRDALDAAAKAAVPAATSSPLTAATVAPAVAAAKQSTSASAPSPGASAGILLSPSTLARARTNEQVAGTAVSGSIAAEESKPSAKRDEDERPGPWLKRLLALREQNQLKELRDQLARFRKAHPDVVLPKALTELPAE